MCLSFFIGIIAASEAQNTTNLFFEMPTPTKVKFYTFNSGDVLYSSRVINTNATPDSKSCNERDYWMRLESFTVELKTTSASELKIYGRSGASTERNVIKVEVAATRRGNFKDITQEVGISGTITNRCGDITISGLDVPKGNFLRITFSQKEENFNVLVSEIEITAMEK